MSSEEDGARIDVDRDCARCLAGIDVEGSRRMAEGESGTREEAETRVEVATVVDAEEVCDGAAAMVGGEECG